MEVTIIVLVYIVFIVSTVLALSLLYSGEGLGFSLLMFFTWPIFLFGVVYMLFGFHLPRTAIKHLTSTAYFSGTMLDDWSEKEVPEEKENL